MTAHDSDLPYPSTDWATDRDGYSGPYATPEYRFSASERRRSLDHEHEHGPGVSGEVPCCEACARKGTRCSDGSCSVGSSAGLMTVERQAAVIGSGFARGSASEPVAMGAEYSAESSAAEYAGAEERIPYASSSSSLSVVPDGVQHRPQFDAAMMAQLRESQAAAAALVGPGTSGTVLYGDPDAGDAGKESGDRIGAEDARRWVTEGLGILNRTLEGRLAEGDRQREREYLERMAAQDLQNNRDDREFRLKLAEIEARYRGVQSSLPAIQTELQQSQSAGNNTGMIVAAVAAVIGLGAVFALRK